MDRSIPLYQNKDFSEFTALTLVLGSACNMKCRHCCQTPIRNACYDEAPEKITSMLMNFLLSCNPQKHEKPKQFVFWGGEPLLYWKFIKNFILRAEKETGRVSGDGFVFSLTTNGTLLTKEKVDFLNEHNVKVGFSYEAPYPFAIRDYVSDEVCELVGKLKNLSISACCANKYNCDPLLAYRCLTAKFHNIKDIDIFEKLNCSFEIPSDIYDYDWDKIRENYKKLRIAAQRGDDFALKKLFMYFKNIHRISILSSQMEADERVIRCPKIDDEIVLTLNGRVGFCGNGDVFLSTVDDTWEDIVRKNKEYGKTLVSPRCKVCRNNDICWKQCTLNIKDENGNFFICDKYMIPFFDVIKNEINNLAEPLSDDDYAWYCEQEKIMERQVRQFLQEGKRYEREHTRLPSKESEVV